MLVQVMPGSVKLNQVYSG